MGRQDRERNGCVTVKDPVTGLNVTTCKDSPQCTEYKAKTEVIKAKIDAQNKVDQAAKKVISDASKPVLDALHAEQVVLDNANLGCKPKIEDRSGRRFGLDNRTIRTK